MRRYHFLLLLLPGLLASCTFFRLVRGSKLKAPDFAFVACRLTGVNENQANLEIVLKAFNPNAIGLRNVTLGYELFHQDNRFLHGDDITLELKPKDTTTLVVPAVVVYRELIKAAGPAAEGLMLNHKSIPVRIDALLAGNPTVYNEVEEGSLFQFSLKTSRTEDIPIPDSFYRDAGKAAGKAARSALKKIF